MRFKMVAACVVAFSLTASPVYACKKDERGGAVSKRPQKAKQVAWQDILFPGYDLKVAGAKGAAPSARGSLVAYEGVAAWVDLFDEGPWARPKQMVKRLDRRGVKALFLQTSSYGQPRDVMHAKTVGTILDSAHRRGIRVVAWYVPSFAKMKVDRRRALKALRFRSRSGERFDSFALDIEATHVSSIAKRNRRLLNLAADLRAHTKEGYALGAITPDPKASLYWPGFPWKRVARRFDVVVPMGYWSFFADGFKEVHRYTEQGIRMIREAADDPDVPVHYIGGIANDADPREVKGFAVAARQKDAIGASLYDAPITSPGDWRALRTFVRPQRPAPAPVTPDDTAELRRVPPPEATIPIPDLQEEAAGRADGKREDRRGKADGKREDRHKKTKGKGRRERDGKHRHRADKHRHREGRDTERDGRRPRR